MCKMGFQIPLVGMLLLVHVYFVHPEGSDESSLSNHISEGEYQELNALGELRLGASAYVNRPRFEQSEVNYVYSPQSIPEEDLALYRQLLTRGDVAIAEILPTGHYYVSPRRPQLDSMVIIDPISSMDITRSEDHDLLMVLNGYKNFMSTYDVLARDDQSLSNVLDQWNRFAGWYASAYALSIMEETPAANSSEETGADDLVEEYNRVLRQEGPHALLETYYENAELNHTVCQRNQWVLETLQEAKEDIAVFRDLASICGTYRATVSTALDKEEFIVRSGERLDEWAYFVDWINNQGHDLRWSIQWPYESYAFVSNLDRVGDVRGKRIVSWEGPDGSGGGGAAE